MESTSPSLVYIWMDEMTDKEFQEFLDERRALNEQHHWYGHVQDVSYIDFGKYMIGTPLFFILLAFCLATGLWTILLLGWLVWAMVN